MAKQEEKKEQERQNSGFKKITKYLRELSVVVIGVAITFIGSTWIGSCQKQRELDGHLAAVRTELEENLVNIKERGEYYEQLARLTAYLESDAPENLTRERVDQLNGDNIIGNFGTLFLKTSAFEMLKSSGGLNRIKGKELSRAIIDCYGWLELTKMESDKYMAEKMTVMRNSIIENEQILYGDILHPKFRKVFYFFAAYLNFETLFQISARQIEATLGLIQAEQGE